MDRLTLVISAKDESKLLPSVLEDLDFTFSCNILFNLKISDVLFTYVMRKTNKYKELVLKSNDFPFCVELPIKAKFKKFNLSSMPSYERSRFAGIKKVNEFKDGFLILISILKILVFRK